MEVLFKEVTLNREPEAVVELNATELTKTFVGVVLCSILPQNTPTLGGVALRGGGGGR